jgi:hypothetical protein
LFKEGLGGDWTKIGNEEQDQVAHWTD